MLELNKSETQEVLDALQEGPTRDKVLRYFKEQQSIANRKAQRQRQQAQMDSDGLCKFDEAWRGRCGKRGFPYCPQHASMKCSKCGAPATHDCAETFQFVCGEPLCDKHNHNSISERDVQRATARQRRDDMRRYGELQEDV